MIQKFKKYYRRNNGLKGTTKSVYNIIRRSGAKGIFERTLKTGGQGASSDYQYWIQHKEEQYPEEKIAKMKKALRKQPKISVIVPVYNVAEVYLRACIDSVMNQYYDNWELCIADDASKAKHVKKVLKQYEEQDERIKVVYRPKNGHISEATNSALEIATGEYIALLDNDDLLKPEALLEVVTRINEYPKTDMLYSDEDKINEDGSVRVWPTFKPDWSPDVFLTRMYLSHLGVYRTKIAKSIGGMRTEYNGAQDYDFVLRFTEQTTHIQHIPKILYHWRMIPGSTALGAENKDYAFLASVRAKEDAMKRREYHAVQVLFEEKMATQVVFYPEEQDRVSILMFLMEDADVKLAQETLSNMRKHSAWRDYEILIGLRHPNMSHFFEPQERLQFFVYEDASEDEMFKQLYPKATGSFIVFIQPGFIMQTDRWIEFGLGQARLPSTGIVGGVIYNTEGYLEETGLIALEPDEEQIELKRGHFGYHISDLDQVDNLQFNADYLLMGNRFLFFEKAKADQVEINEDTVAYEHFAYLLSIKLYAAGMFNVYDSGIEVLNKRREKIGDKIVLDADFIVNLSENEREILANDPFYNPNLNRQNGDYYLQLK